MKNTVCDNLRDHRKDIVDGITVETLMLATRGYRSVEEYIESMRKSTTYADEIEIWVLSRIFNLAIITFTQVNNKFEFSQAMVGPNVSRTNPKEVYLNHVDDDHYEPLFVTDPKVRKEHIKKHVFAELKLISSNGQEVDFTDSMFKFDVHSEEGDRLKRRKSRSKVSVSEVAEADAPAEYNPNTGRFLDEYEEELRQEFLMLSLVWSDPKKPARKRPASKDNALRTRRGDKAVDQAGKDEIRSDAKEGNYDIPDCSGS